MKIAKYKSQNLTDDEKGLKSKMLVFIHVLYFAFFNLLSAFCI